MRRLMSSLRLSPGAHLAAALVGGAVCAQPLPPGDCLQPAAAQVGPLVTPIAQQQDVPLISAAGKDSRPREGVVGLESGEDSRWGEHMLQESAALVLPSREQGSVRAKRCG